MGAENRLSLRAALVEVGPLRHTPAGVPLVRFRVAHRSDQTEAETARKVELQMDCIAVEAQARIVAALPLGTAMHLSGFVAPRARTSKQITFHIDTIDFEKE